MLIAAPPLADDQGSILVLLLDVHLFYDDDSRGGKTRSSWSLAPDVLLQQASDASCIVPGPPSPNV